ncbi:MAG: flagellar hook basal-body protein [Candidatus Eremiobacteraeota bacterium]|nr:flagellar hook basal-body protein [Candidatus Eremiobacteraeota bacterium]
MLVPGIDKVTKRLSQEFWRLDQLANNQANADTPGFQATLSGLRAGNLDQWRDGRAGTQTVTERQLDLGLPEGSYLQVKSQGVTFFTRRGDLKMDNDGYLTTGSGEQVLDASGSPIKIGKMESTRVAEDGGVYVDGKSVARIPRYTVSAMTEKGGVLFTPAPQADIAEDIRPMTVGSLERSNVEVADSMAELVATMNRARVFQNTASLQDSTVERALREMTGGR